MAGVDLLLFVSKRASAVTAALLCLAVVHLAAAAAPSSEPAGPGEVRIAIPCIQTPR